MPINLHTFASVRLTEVSPTSRVPGRMQPRTHACAHSLTTRAHIVRFGAALGNIAFNEDGAPVDD